ncbi:MAG: cobalamin biosynthesis protein CobD [Verrucomicrobia bacterium]|nr:cobalamin biosynthesis protein CobD [Verrucomicrobiota bacterium]
MWKLDPLQVTLAVALDGVAGDPPGWPHVTRATGWLASRFERSLTRCVGRTVGSGLAFWLAVCGTVLASFGLLRRLLGRVHPAAAWAADVLAVYQALAAADLVRHIRAVLAPLRAGNLAVARVRLAMVVGRDTHNLDRREISRAAIETLAESSNDAFVAPLFWAVVAGPGGALLYRIANTLDSIVGHRDERYEAFGKVSARADDALNWLPERLCAAVSESRHRFRNWGEIRREAVQHASPNAGWSESAAAWAMGVRLGGVNFYDGIPLAGPVFHPAGREPGPEEIASGINWFRQVALVASAALIVTSALRYLSRV